jgi:hypothetical protein
MREVGLGVGNEWNRNKVREEKPGEISDKSAA